MTDDAMLAQRAGPCVECGQETVVIHEKPWARRTPHHARAALSAPAPASPEAGVSAGLDDIEAGGIVARALIAALADRLPDWTLDDYSGLALVIVRALAARRTP